MNKSLSLLESRGATVKTSVCEYYPSENLREWKHEYFQGQAIARSPGTVERSQISVSLGSELSHRFRGTSYQALASSLRVRIQQADCVLYPDISILLGRPELDRHDAIGGTIKNPCAVIEINPLSPIRFDEAKRRDHYSSSHH